MYDGKVDGFEPPKLTDLCRESSMSTSEESVNASDELEVANHIALACLGGPGRAWVMSVAWGSMVCVKSILGFGSSSACRAVISATREICAFTLGTCAVSGSGDWSWA